MSENFGVDANALFSPTLVVGLIQLTRAQNLVKKNFWPFYCLIIILRSIFDSSEKAAIKSIDKPTAIHLQK